MAAFLSRAVSAWQCSYLVHFSVAVFLSRPFQCGSILMLWSFFFFPGRYEITEIPLPSSVIEQINKNNMQATLNPGQVTPTGVPTSATKNIQRLQPPGPGEIT